MKEFDIKEIIDSLNVFNNQRSYWFIRTQGGDFYKTFLDNSYIAIGYDSINLSLIKNAANDKSGKKYLAEVIKKQFPDESKPGYIGNQLIDFSYNIKKGDIVIIPSESSSKISIGEVLETPIYELTNNLGENDCPYLKRKKIKWLKQNLTFNHIDPKLLSIKYSQRTITRIQEEFHPYIDRIISPIYIKNDNAHLAINVERKENFPAYDVFTTWTELLDLTEEFGKDEQIEINKKDIDLKINVQSPGTIEFITYSVIGIVVLATLVTALIGAEYESNSRPFRFKFKSDGLIKKVSDFLDKKKDREFKENLTKKLKEMDIKPEELVDLLKSINGNSNQEN
ncbi:hypothetical protein V3Q90_15805 [Flavobacterium oreochromis]|uniref:Uncharacterized protein n=1 Tax=Flavobacterium oreochromis TaxID=2906078 RepID=A0ABW8PC98_9FLAO|nr:hypothetical protein [Flavobacterium oreochromis]OWP74112.1 hypothetical protein BWG23_14950 [Flavobacterium oreochromis]